MTEDREKLIALIADLKEDASLELVRQLMAEGADPLAIIDICHKGLVEVGKRYEQGIYFISGLIMAGEIMRKAGELVLPLIESKVTNGDSGSIVLGTVEGDIHFIGKDIFKVLVRGYGFAVHDLGVDVPPGKFAAAIQEFKPDIVGLSCLISGAFKSMRETIAFLRDAVPQSQSPRAYMIGGRVDELVSKDVGADYWTNDAIKGVRLCQKIVGKP